MRKQFGSSVLLLACLTLRPASAQRVTFDENVVINPAPYRIGINIGSQDYYSGELMKNLVCNMNCGFEPALTQEIWPVTYGTATTFRSDNASWDSAPANYWKGATITVVQSSGPARNCSAKVTAQTAAVPGKTGPVFTFSPPCKGAIRTGDLVVLSRTLIPTPESWWESSTSGIWGSLSAGATLTSDTTDLVPTSVDAAGGGLQALKITTPNPNSSAAVVQYFDTQAGNVWVKLRGIYRGSFDAKLLSGRPTFHVVVQRLAKNGIYCSYTPALRSSWEHYTFNCAGNEAGIGDANCDPPANVSGCTQPGPAKMELDQNGDGAVEVDNMSFERITPADKSNPSVFRDEIIDTLKLICAKDVSGPPCTLRYHLSGQNAETMANWTRPNNFVKLPTAAGQGTLGKSDVAENLTLNDFLVICRLIGAEPRLVIPVTFSTSDARSLVEFLAGPTTTKYGAIRQSLGQSQPWTTVFRTIHLSFCNECWNFMSFSGQAIGWRSHTPEYYYDYSLRAGAIFDAMRSDPYYRPSLELIMGFQEAQNWTVDAALARAHPDAAEIAAYTMPNVGGPEHSADSVFWPEQLAQPYIMATQASDPNQFHKQINDIQAQKVCGASHTARCKLTVYEFNNSTFLGDKTLQSGWKPGVTAPTQEEEDHITQGAGQGVAQALQAIEFEHVYPEIEDQNLFSLTEYFNGTAVPGLRAKLWGSVVDMGGATGNLRAAALGVAVANASVIGPEFSCPLTGAPAFNLPEDKANGVPAVSNVPLLYAFCYKATSGTSRSILLFNTDTTHAHNVTFNGDNAPSGSIVVRQFAPANLDDLNEAPTGHDTNEVRAKFGIRNHRIEGFNPWTGVNLPPHSITAIDYAVGRHSISASPVSGRPEYAKDGAAARPVSLAAPDVKIAERRGGTSFAVDGR